MSELPEGFTLDQATPALPEGFTLDQPKKLGFLQRVGDDLKERRQMFNEINDAYLSGEQSYAETSLQLFGKVGAGAVLDFIGEAIISGGRGLSTITPDVIEDPIKGGATAVGHMFLNTDLGQRGLEAATKGIREWEVFKENNPRAARNIEAVVDIAFLYTPVKGKPKASPTAVGKTGAALQRSAGRVAREQRKTFIEKLVSPKKMKAIREIEVGRTTEAGLLKQKQTALSEAEREIANAVEAVKGVSFKKTLQGNYNAISKASRQEAKRLKNNLSKNDFRFTKKEWDDALDDVLIFLKQETLLTGDAAKTAERIVSKIRDLKSAGSGGLLERRTGSALLRARKDLDAWIRSQKGAKIFDPAMENAQSTALRAVRKATNDFIIERAPRVAVRKSLNKQWRLMQALDNIAPKAADEAANSLLRLWHRGLKLLPLRGEFNQAMAAVWGIGGLGASALFAPAFTKLAFGALGSYAMYRGITGPAARRELGRLLRGIDRMIRTTKDANLIRELRVDRALVIELSRAAEQEIEP